MKKETEWERVYKCRLCGKTFSNDLHCFKFQQGYTCSLDEWITRGASTTEIHKCGVQKRGIADYIGVRVSKSEENKNA